MEKVKDKKVEDYLREVDYRKYEEMVPSAFAIEFINFIKLVNGAQGEENKSPVFHYRMIEPLGSKYQNVVNLCYRGSAKTTLMEYLILYIAVYQHIPEFGEVDLGLYVSDSIENGVKNMRKNLEYRRENSEFLMQYLPSIKFTDVRWEFTNRSGQKTIFKGYGAVTGVRGAKEKAKRPQIALFDDLLTDEGAKSKTIMATVEDTVYAAVMPALDPKRRKVIWNGTPFNKNDPLHKAVESGGWYVNVYPICNEFPCDREDFVGAWEDRFDYDFVMSQYELNKSVGKLSTFYQEYMLRVVDQDTRLVQDDDVVWYNSLTVRENPEAFNFYITTDFATSASQSADYSVVALWAYTNSGNWLLVDGWLDRVTLEKSIDKVFEYAGEWTLQQVGIEVTGQQGGFIPWIYREMSQRNCYFPLASENNNNKEGIRPVSKKEIRFNTVVPLFKAKKIWLPEDQKNTKFIQEVIEEISLVTFDGIKSKRDDCIDVISMLSSLQPWKPSQTSTKVSSPEWDDNFLGHDNGGSYMDSYIV